MLIGVGFVGVVVVVGISYVGMLKLGVMGLKFSVEGWDVDVLLELEFLFEVCVKFYFLVFEMGFMLDGNWVIFFVKDGIFEGLYL